MVRSLLRIVLLIIVIAAVAAFFVGYRVADRDNVSEPDFTVGTSGTDADVERAREAGARVGETVAVGANRAQQLASDAALTVKIKSKMTLDDTIDAADIDVDTTNGVVTLRGAVDTSQQQQRATQLARETEGVTSVVDQLTVQ